MVLALTYKATYSLQRSSWNEHRRQSTRHELQCPLSTEEMSSPRPVGQATSITHSNPSHHDALFRRGEMIFSIAKTPKSHGQAKNSHPTCESWRIEQLKNVAADSHTVGSLVAWPNGCSEPEGAQLRDSLCRCVPRQSERHAIILWHLFFSPFFALWKMNEYEILLCRYCVVLFRSMAELKCMQRQG